MDHVEFHYPETCRQKIMPAGCFVFLYKELFGWGKKYDDLLRKNADIREEVEKRKIFTVL